MGSIHQPFISFAEYTTVTSVVDTALTLCYSLTSRITRPGHIAQPHDPRPRRFQLAVQLCRCILRSAAFSDVQSMAEVVELRVIPLAESELHLAAGYFPVSARVKGV